MLAILKADCRRLLHSKGFWALEAGFLLVNLTIIILAQPAVLEFLDSLNGVSTTMPKLHVYGLTAISQAVESAGFIQLYMIFMTLYILGSDLSRQVYKNSLSVGVSRLQYFLNKWLVLILLTGFNLVLFTAFRTLYASLFLDMSGVTPEFWLQTGQVLLIQWLFTQFWLSVIMAALYLTHSPGLSVILYFVIGPSISGLQQLFGNITWVRYIDVYPGFELLSDPNLPLAFLISISLTTLFACAGYTIFQRKDL